MVDLLAVEESADQADRLIEPIEPLVRSNEVIVGGAGGARTVKAIGALVPPGVTLHDWQRKCLPIWLDEHGGHGTVKVATGGGKTLFALATWTGPFATAVQSITGSDVKTYKTLVWTCEGTNFGDGADHVLTLGDVRIDSVDIAEGDPTSYTINFTVFGSVVAT